MVASKDGGALLASQGTELTPVESRSAPSTSGANLRPSSVRADSELASVSQIISEKFRPTHGATLSFVDCKYVVKVKAKGDEAKLCPAMVDRVLIEDCSARIAPGEVRA
eukprot:4841083-Prymnesium_polylepis.1